MLREDDTESMVALLRYIYGLPYDECFSDRPHMIRSHVKVYVVAEKYQMQGLKLAIGKNLKRKVQTEMDLGKENADLSIADFIEL